MAKSKEEEISIDVIPQEDIIIGKNPYTIIYSKMSADGKNGEKLEVVRNHKGIVLLVKVTEMVDGNVSVSISSNGNIGTSVDSDRSVIIN